MKKPILLFIAITFVFHGLTFAQQNILLELKDGPIVYTCRGGAIATKFPTRELNAQELAGIDYEFFDPNGYYYHLGITPSDIVGNYTAYYNCHAYAFHLTEGNIIYAWILAGANTENLSKYWDSSVGCFEASTEAEAVKIHYYAGDHSAVKSSVAGKYESKFGQWYVIRHDPEQVPYINATYHHYYKRTPIINGLSPVCYNGSSFTLDNPPSGTIFWTVSNTSLFTVNSTGNPVTVTRIGSDTGNATLSARINSINGSVVATKLITACAPSIISGNNTICYGGSVFSLSPNVLGMKTWTVTGPFSFDFNSVVKQIQANSPTVYRTTESGASGTLSAYLGNTTGTLIDTKPITACQPVGISGQTNLITGTTYSFSVTNPPQSYTWDKSSNLTGSGPTFTAVSAGSGWVRILVNGKEVAKHNVAITAPPTPATIDGPDLFCSSEYGSFNLETWKSAKWSVSSGFSVSPATGSSTIVTSSVSYNWGTLTAEVNGVISTKYIISFPTPDCYFPPSDFIYMTEVDCGAYVKVEPSDNIYDIYRWDIISVDGVTLSFTSGSDNNFVEIWFSDDGGWARIDAFLYQHPYGYSPHPTIEYRIGTISCGRSLPVIVYPNPVSGDILTIELEAKALVRTKHMQSHTRDAQEPVFDIRLYDGQGNLLRQTFTKSNTEQFNVSNLPAGLYYLHVYDGISDKPEIKQIIVER